MKNNIKAEIITHSKREGTGEEIITYKLTFPRIILSEVNTYKMGEKNTSSSRAISFDKMVEVVENDPFIPIAWQKSHKGMQGTEYYTDANIIESKVKRWLEARDAAVLVAKNMDIDITYIKEKVCLDYRDVVEGENYKMVEQETINPVTKQLKNRLLEGFMWVTQIFTGTRECFEHIFEQRCPQYEFYFGKFKSKKDVLEYINVGEIEYPKPFPKTDLDWLKCNKGQAEIHFMDLAEKMYDALQESKPQILKENQWHIPFDSEITQQLGTLDIPLEDMIKMSVAKTARISYTTIDGTKDLTLEQAEKIYEKCKQNGHFSVFSHIAKCMDKDEYESWIKGPVKMVCFSEFEDEFVLEAPEEAKGWNKNLKGFLSYRQTIENELNHTL